MNNEKHNKISTARCAICGTSEQLLRCAKCKSVFYCTTSHQHMDWATHRQVCRIRTRHKPVSTTLLEGNAAATANCSTAQMMTPAVQAQIWPNKVDNLLNLVDVDVNISSSSCQNYYLPHSSTDGIQSYKSGQSEKTSSYQIGLPDANFFGSGCERRYEDLCQNIIKDMNQYGLSVVDDFLGLEKGLQILNEVRSMYNAGVFHDGQLVHMKTDTRTSSTLRGDKIRGDKIKWVGGQEPGCGNVCYLTNQIDSVVYRINTMKNNGTLGNYLIRERTRAMVACYPGSGTHYVMHVDNPNRDGRVITAIYYLNINWNANESGGILRIRPTPGTIVADIEPKFDRLIFFWSDIRNPHEVQPAHRTRYAITVWYFDAKEREEALKRAQKENSKLNNALPTQQTEPNSLSSSDLASLTESSSLVRIGSHSLTPSSMSTGSTLNSNVSKTSCVANSEICT